MATPKVFLLICEGECQGTMKSLSFQVSWSPSYTSLSVWSPNLTCMQSLNWQETWLSWQSVLFTEKTTVLPNLFSSSSLCCSACHFICLNQENENNKKAGCSLLWFGLIKTSRCSFCLSVWMTHKLYFKKMWKKIIYQLL